jgi:hypothetical protein
VHEHPATPFPYTGVQVRTLGGIEWHLPRGRAPLWLP